MIMMGKSICQIWVKFGIVHCSLPDDDRDICVFDYYVDESGEWDPWISR